MMEFIKKRAAPAILIISVVVCSWYWWMNKAVYTGLPLYEVTGQTLKGGQPASGIQVFFEPVGGGIDDQRPLVKAISGEDGKFRVMYDPSFYGAPAGDYRIGLMDENGRPVEQSEALTFTVKTDGKNEFTINL